MGLGVQEWNANQYAENVRFVSELGGGVLDLLDPQVGERILDLGCGDGPLTVELAKRGCEVLGVDGSADMVEAAQRLGVDARVMDGQALTFEDDFDAVFSNAALHWMTDYDAVLRGVRRALRPGGRFVAEFGGGNNVATIVSALSVELEVRGHCAGNFNPWYFPEPDAYAALLDEHDFEVRHMELFERPTPLPGDVIGWLETFAQNFMAPIDAQDRGAYLRAVKDRLKPALCDAQERWTADYVRLRFAAVRKD